METSKRDTYLITGASVSETRRALEKGTTDRREEAEKRGETVRRYRCREELTGMSIANGHLYVNGLIVAKVSSRAERRILQSEANETDRLGGGKIRDTAGAKRERRAGARK